MPLPIHLAFSFNGWRGERMERISMAMMIMPTTNFSKKDANRMSRFASLLNYFIAFAV